MTSGQKITTREDHPIEPIIHHSPCYIRIYNNNRTYYL